MTSPVIPTFRTREEWLGALVDTLRPRLAGLGYGLPDKLLISCGWPSTRALAKNRRRIGEAWSFKASADGSVQIFISPVLSDPVEVAETVVHELGHASLGADVGHKAPFRSFMKAIGLEGKPTATIAGSVLRSFLASVTAGLGPYPNSRLDKLETTVKKQTTRMRKLFCPNETEHKDAPYILRGSRKVLDLGLPTCPCGTELVAEETDDDDETEDQ